MDITSVLRTKIKFPVRLKTSKKFFEKASGLGFLGAVGILLASLTLPNLFMVLSNNIEDPVGPILMFIMFIIIAMSYGLMITIPALWLGTKEGWQAGIWVIIYEILWLLIIILFFILLIFMSLPDFIWHW